MKKLLLALVGLLAVANLSQATESLHNPGLLNSGVFAPTQWQTTSSKLSDNGNTTSVYHTLTPGWYIATSGTALYQDVPATKLATAAFSAYLYRPSTGGLTGGRSAVCKLQFYNGAGTYLSSAYASTSVTAATTANTWTQVTGSTTVPATAAKVRFYVYAKQNFTGGGTFAVDDCSLAFTAATATASPTNTTSPTASPSPSNTPNGTYTATPIVTATPFVTSTPKATFSKTNTPNYTATITATTYCTRTPVITNTAVTTFSPTRTRTPTPTKTYTPMPTYTPTPGVVHQGAINCNSIDSAGGNTLAALYVSPGYINLGGVWFMSGTATTRDAARLSAYGQAAPIGSLYFSTGGKAYLKKANSNTTTDYQSLSSTAGD